MIIGTRGYPSYYGGFETAVRKIAPYLVDSGWDVTVYGRRGATRDHDPARDRRVHQIQTLGIQSKSLSTLSYGLTASFHAFRTKPDVAIVMNVANGFFLPFLSSRGIRSIVNVDGIEWDRAKWGKTAKRIFRLGAWMTAKCADELVYDSHEIARRWRSDFGRDGVYIPYGGDVSGELPIEPGLRHRGYVLLVARLVPENTIPEFVAAASQIARLIPVVIVGSSGYGGPVEDGVRQLAKTDENVSWLGHISDDRRLLSLWKHAAVYFHGHSVGGTNPTLVQAMAAGAPIVARDTPYNREVVGDGGVFVQPSRDSIAEAVIGLAGDPQAQERASRLNLERAIKCYSWEGVCKAYEDSVTSILTDTGGCRQTEEDRFGGAMGASWPPQTVEPSRGS